MPTSDQAICLRATDYSETSQVLTLLTRGGGIVRLMAKGSKRPKSSSGGRVDLFAEGQAVFSGAGREALGTLREFAETVSHVNLRSDLGRLNAALYMLELCGATLADSDPHPQVFDLLHNALARMAQANAAPAAVLAYFQWRLAKHVGMLGQLDTCAACDGELDRRGVYFSSSAGGLLCGNCEPAATEKHAVSAAALAGLVALAEAEAGRRAAMADPQAQAVNALLAYHISYQLGRPLKSARQAIGR